MSTTATTAAPAPDDDDADLTDAERAEFRVGEPAGDGGGGGGHNDEVDALRRLLAQMQTSIRRLQAQVVPRYWPTAGSVAFIPVALTENGTGADGTDTSKATWKYIAVDSTGVTHGTNLSPVWPRPNGQMAKATRGVIAKPAAGSVTLEIAYEYPVTTNDCS